MAVRVNKITAVSKFLFISDIPPGNNYRVIVKHEVKIVKSELSKN